MLMTDRFKAFLPLGAKKSIKVARAALFERLGSFRYSTPALNNLDSRMAALVPRDGVFLEVGANDGYSQSNTYFLERAMGWRGILIEPLPSLFSRCTRARKAAFCVNAACVAESFPGQTVELVDLDLMSVTLGQQSLDEEARRLIRGRAKVVHAPARTLTEIIDDSPYDHVDFMSIDVEGAELALLAGLDLGRFAPRWLLIETAHPDEVEKALRSHLRLIDRLSHHDYLFERLQ